MIMPSRIKGAVSYKKHKDCDSRSRSCSKSKHRKHGC